MNIINLPYKHLVHCIISIETGWTHEPIGKRGITHFTEHLIFEGNEKYPNPDKLTQSLGAVIEGTTLPYRTLFYFTSYKEDFYNIFNMILSLIFNPSYDIWKNRMETIRNNDIKTATVSMSDFQPWDIAYEWAKNIILKREILHSLGTTEEIDSITLNDLMEWHKKFYTYSNTNIIIEGDIDSKKAKEIVSEYEDKAGEKPNYTIYKHSSHNTIEIGSEASETVWGFEIEEYSPTWEVIRILLGNYPISYLWKPQIKDYAYMVESQLEIQPEREGFFIYAGINNYEDKDKVEKNLFSIIEDFSPNKEMIESAKKIRTIEILKDKEGAMTGLFRFVKNGYHLYYKEFDEIIKEIEKVKDEEIIKKVRNLILRNHCYVIVK